MAALMNSYQPEGIGFSQHYSKRSFEADFEEVKSKPRAKTNSYVPLLNESSHREEWRERYRSEASTRTGSQMYEQKSSDYDNPRDISSSCPPRELSWTQFSLSDNVLSTISTKVDVHSLISPTALSNGNENEKGVDSDLNEGDANFVKVDLGAPSLVIPDGDDSQTESENEQEGVLDSCKVALLADHQQQGRNGTQRSQPSSITLGLPGDILCSPGGLAAVLFVGHRKCTVSLDDECIKWQILSRKSAKMDTLYLSDVYAVSQGMSSQNSHTPITPRSPLVPVLSHGSASSSFSTLQPSTSTPTHTPRQLTNQKLKRRASTLSMSSVGSNCCFTLYALKSRPNSIGELFKVSFRCPNHEVAQTWQEQITHQMQNFGNRPRKLFVVLNPESGGGNNVDKIWKKVHKVFQMASIHMDVLTTQHRFHAREQIQSLELSQYDGIIAVGGDGLFNEVLNGLLIQTQQQSGVNLRRSRFVPVTPSIRLGAIPTGFNNSVCRSIFGCKSPMVAAAQIMLGCSSPVDVSSVCNNNSLLLFSAGPMAYGFWSDTALFSQDINWLGSRKFDVATVHTLLSHHHFEAEIQFLPVEDHEDLLEKKEKCYNRCQKCSNFDSHLDSACGTSEKGASIMATYNEVDRVDKSKWKTINGQFSSVMACLHTCCGVQAPHGISPYGHVGNGSTDLIMLSRCSTFNHAKWLLKHRKKSSCLFDHPYVHIRRVKEFKFREILSHTGMGSDGCGSSHSSPDDGDINSVDNLVTERDDDEVTNSRIGQRPQGHGGHASQGGRFQPTSRWNVDGDELSNNEIDVRPATMEHAGDSEVHLPVANFVTTTFQDWNKVHRHLISVFARGPEPPSTDFSSPDHLEEAYEEDNLSPES